MRPDVIKSLICPSCKTSLRLSNVPDLRAAKNGQEIEFGVAACDCRKYPIIYGILVYKELKRTQEAIETILNARSSYALEKTILLFIGERHVSFVLHLEMIFKRVFGSGFRMTFWKLATFISNSPFATYAKHRFSCPSLISAMPFFPLIKKALSNGGSILDLSCGMGHLSYIMSRFFGPENIYCADLSYRGLYFARRFLPGQRSTFILFDAQESFPFRSKSFQAVVSIDALNFIENKESCMSEVNRVLKDNGPLLLIHLHNKLVPFIANGLPLTADGYKELLPRTFTFKYFSEKALMNTMFKGKDLDMSMENDMDDVNRSDAISMLAVRDRGYLVKYPNYFDFSGISMSTEGSAYKDEKFILNPLYRKRRGQYVLVSPAERYEEEYYLIKDFFLPLVDPELPEDELKKKLVFIPVPGNYMKKNEQMNYIRLWR